MQLTLMDPALLLYEMSEWRTGEAHFLSRVRALALHRHHIKKYKQQVAISDPMRSAIFRCFPMGAEFKHNSDLHDFRLFVLDDLTRARTIEGGAQAKEIVLQPDTLTCMCQEAAAATDCWKELLGNCIAGEDSTKDDIQVATWSLPIELTGLNDTSLHVTCQSSSLTRSLPLVFDEKSWAKRLDYEDYWPDLEVCVELYFRSNAAMQGYAGIKEPIRIRCSTEFMRSVESRCQRPTRSLLVKAIAKKVYGIHDPGLHDERFKSVRRLRVDRSWRVHYQKHGDELVLLEFGHHDMGL